MKKETILRTTIYILFFIGLIITCSSKKVNAQYDSTLTVIQTVGDKSDTITLQLATDTTVVKMMYVDNTYVRAGVGIQVVTGYGNQAISGFFSQIISAKYFMFRDNMFIRIKSEDIWSVEEVDR